MYINTYQHMDTCATGIQYDEPHLLVGVLGMKPFGVVDSIP